MRSADVRPQPHPFVVGQMAEQRPTAPSPRRLAGSGASAKIVNGSTVVCRPELGRARPVARAERPLAVDGSIANSSGARRPRPTGSASPIPVPAADVDDRPVRRGRCRASTSSICRPKLVAAGRRRTGRRTPRSQLAVRIWRPRAARRPAAVRRRRAGLDRRQQVHPSRASFWPGWRSRRCTSGSPRPASPASTAPTSSIVSNRCWRSVRLLNSPTVCAPRSISTDTTADSPASSASASGSTWRYLVARFEVLCTVRVRPRPRNDVNACSISGFRVGHHRLAAGRLVAGVAQAVDRERVGVGCRGLLLDQAAEHPQLVSTEVVRCLNTIGHQANRTAWIGGRFDETSTNESPASSLYQSEPVVDPSSRRSPLSSTSSPCR